jgi:hypothetical protein
MTTQSGPTRALSLWQPWASLVALGHKRIETRSWSTRYRGPLVIHASKRCEAIDLGDFTVEDDTPRSSPKQYLLRGPISWPYRLPMGAVVATCELIDVVPIIGAAERIEEAWMPHVAATVSSGDLWHWKGPSATESLCTGRPSWLHEDINDQRPYGDFTPGRFAWLLADIRAVSPIPATGHQGLWNWEAA